MAVVSACESLGCPILARASSASAGVVAFFMFSMSLLDHLEYEEAADNAERGTSRKAR